MNKHAHRYQSDEMADEAFLWLKAHPAQYQHFLTVTQNARLIDFADHHGAFSTLVRQFDMPDPDVVYHLNSGARFFERYCMEILTILGLYSLPYCYAGANGVRVLMQSRKIRENPELRLIETAQFVFDVCRVDAFTPQGGGLASILKVRLMHAAARYYASHSIRDETPINQEDMLATMLSFSLIVIRGLRKIGVSVDKITAEEYYQLWVYIGGLMGIRKEYLPQNMQSASVLERGIRRREFKKSEGGVELTKVLVAYLSSMGVKGISPESLMYYLLGENLADILDLKPQSILKSQLVATGLRTQNFFKAFSERNFRDVLVDFERNLKKENIKPAFNISFE
ncbi:MAG: oxygenase MpaB family protein [Marinoscillum sp.]|uniref:oxygenase MpaB family protein n=1 Tax=Marinoscillum sp. TaxID=2024838 RepID=UPI00330397F3